LNVHNTVFGLKRSANLIHGFLGSTESSTQTASWSLQPFLQSSIVWQTDRLCYTVS